MSAPIRLELEDRMATGGDGIGRLPDGRIVMVDGALPGETVLAEVVRDRRDHARAAVTRIERPSPHRIPPPCPHHRRGCGGCPWMEVDPDAQVALKQRMALEALARLGRVEPVVVLPPVRAATSGYRTTLHLAVDGDGRPGFRRRHRATPVAVDSCLVAHPSLAVVLDELRLPGRDRAALRVGTADGARLLVLPRPGPRPIGLPDDVSVVEPGATASIHEDVGGRRWQVSARSFFQAGPSAAEAVLAAVATALGDAVGPGDVLVDAYAGVGVLGGSMAARLGTRLVSVESDPGASSDATENLADLDARVDRTEVGRWTPRSAQAVIADPARTGLGRPGVASLVATGAGRLVLVSCDPASAARDAALLAAEGYRLETLQVVDTFARTVHVEVVCRYDRIGAGRS